jgi:tetratricopeptide (TPR) repeat protein
MQETEAVSLLRAAIDGEPALPQELASALANLCGRLPLALRIAAEKISERPNELVELVADLSDEARRLSLLTLDDDDSSEVRAVFSWSYRDLPHDASKLFRLIGLHSGPEISVGAAAALIGQPLRKVSGILGILASAHILEYIGNSRYKMHDLLRLYARERVNEEESADERLHAVRRVLTWYLHVADAADRVLRRTTHHRPELDPLEHNSPLPVFNTHAEAMRWCDVENANLAAGVIQASKFRLHAIAWMLPINMWGYLVESRRWPSWIAPYHVAYESARSLGDSFAEAWTVHNLGQAYRELRLYSDAQQCYEKALELRRRTGDTWGEAHTLTAIGRLHLDQGLFESSIHYLDRSLEVHENIRDPSGLGATLQRLGDAYNGIGDADSASAHYDRALIIWTDIGNVLQAGWVHNSIGLIRECQQDLQSAVDCLEKALAAHESIGHDYGTATILVNLGRCLLARGQKEEARACWCRARDIFESLGDSGVQQVVALIDRLDLDLS